VQELSRHHLIFNAEGSALAAEKNIDAIVFVAHTLMLFAHTAML
jgi:hypothetical protein